MTTVVTRAGKGSPLTNNEVDANFINLNTDKIEVVGTPTTGQYISWSGTAWVPSSGNGGTVTSVNVSGASTGLTFSGGPITSSGTIALDGTLAVGYGGTGATTAAGARTNLGAAASGANSDITSMSGLTGAISSPTYIQYGNGSGTTLAAGRMWYDQTTGSMNVGMGGGNITQQIGEEIFVYGKASAAITDSPLQIVYQTGTVGASGVITFAPTASGLTDGNLIIGVATENIALNGFGRVTSFGVVHGITTDGTAYGEVWADGDTIWYNPVTGNPTNVKPVAPNIKVQVGILIKAGNGGSGSIQVEVNHGSVLGGTDSNVQITSPANNDLLQYSASLGYWRNIPSTSVAVTSFNTRTGNVTLTSGDVTGALGYTPYNSSNPAGYITGITSGNITTALGYTPANKAGDTFTGNIVLSNGADRRVRIGSSTNYYYDLQTTGDNFQIIEVGTTPRLTISYPSGAVTAATDFRAPIFYDSNDTVYFVDPNSTSVLNATRSNTIQFANGNTAITLNNGTYQMLQDPTGRTGIYIGGSDAGNYYDNTTHYFRDRSAVVSMTVTSGIGQANGSFRAPIFYDSNDTSYYVDPASSSVLNTLYLRTGSIQAKFAQTSQFGYSSSYRTVVLGNEYLTTISMGVDVSGNASGNFNGQGEGREVIFRNGVNFITPNSANNNYLYPLNMTDGYVTSSGSFRAPIFYDTDNTNYFVNAASNSSLYSFNLNGNSTIFGGYGNANGLGIENQGSFIRFAFYDLDFWDWDLGSVLRLNGFAQSSTSFRAPIFYDSDNTAYYTDPSGDTVLAGNLFIGQAANASYIYMGDSDNGQRVIHNNSNRIGFLTQGGGWGSFCEDEGYWQSDYSVRAPIFYDSNNTGYYVDPSSVSYLQTIAIETERTYLGSINNDYSSGYYHFSDTQNTPTGAYGHAHIIRLNADWNVQMFFPTSNTNEPMWLRRKQNGTYSAWRRLLQENEWIGGKYFSSDGQIYSTILYDSDNSGYYVNPASTSVFNEISLYSELNFLGAGAKYVDFNGDIYFRYSDNGSFWNDRMAISTGNYVTANGSFRAPIFYKSDDTISRWDGNALILRGSSPTVYFRDTDHNSAMIHCNSNLLYVLRGGNDSESWSQVNGQWPLVINLTNNDMTVGGSLAAVGNVTAYSDARLKDNVETVSDALNLVSAMRGVTYTRKDTGQAGVGVIAQEMREVLPEVVIQVSGDDDTLSVAYGNIVGVLIEAIKELNNKVEDLEAKLRSE